MSKPDLQQLCKAMEQTVAAVPARFELVATDPITGQERHRIVVEPARARAILADLIAAATRKERRRVEACTENLGVAASQ